LGLTAERLTGSSSQRGLDLLLSILLRAHLTPSAAPELFGLDPAHLELAELPTAEGCTSSDPLSVWFEQIDKTIKRRAVAQRVTVDDEGNAGERPKASLAVVALDSLTDTNQRRE
jgi:hypothetical protein